MDDKYQELFQSFNYKIIHHWDDIEGNYNCGVKKLNDDIYLNWLGFNVYILKDLCNNKTKIFGDNTIIMAK